MLSHRSTTSWALSAALLPALSGCSLLYRDSYEAPQFVMYSNRSTEFLETAASRADRIYSRYREVFDVRADALGKTTILLEGEESRVTDHNYAPSLLGFYVPLLNLISIDTNALATREPEALDQVLQHEIAHHFVVTEFPAASSECWLNEGIAGALEVSLLTDEGGEFPLLNPVLLQLARKAVLERPRPGHLKKLLELGWSEFHHGDDKEESYALSWSVVYFILTRASPSGLSLGDRIERLYHLDRSKIANLETRWTAFLEQFDLTEHLAVLARSDHPARRLTSPWAIRQLGTLQYLDDVLVLDTLASLLEHPSSVKRHAACEAFLRVLARHPHAVVLAYPWAVGGLDAVARYLADPLEEPARREIVLQEVHARHAGHPGLVRALVGLLEDPNGKIRAAAATALSRIGQKRTVVSPAFWLHGPNRLQEKEIGEWRAWLDRRAPAPVGS